MSVPTPPSYVDLAAVKGLLRVTNPDTARDAVLLRLIDGVETKLRSAPKGWDQYGNPRGGLGVTWSGVTPDLTHEVRTCVVHDAVAHFDVPAYRVDGAAVGDELLLPPVRAFYDGDRKWWRGAILASPAPNGLSSVLIDARWADAPGGTAPADVVTFAEWCVAQLWRRRTASASGQLNPEGYTVTIDDPWKSTDWKDIYAAHRVTGKRGQP